MVVFILFLLVILFYKRFFQKEKLSLNGESIYNTAILFTIIFLISISFVYYNIINNKETFENQKLDQENILSNSDKKFESEEDEYKKDEENEDEENEEEDEDKKEEEEEEEDKYFNNGEKEDFKIHSVKQKNLKYNEYYLKNNTTYIPTVKHMMKSAVEYDPNERIYKKKYKKYKKNNKDNFLESKITEEVKIPLSDIKKINISSEEKKEPIQIILNIFNDRQNNENVQFEKENQYFDYIIQYPPLGSPFNSKKEKEEKKEKEDLIKNRKKIPSYWESKENNIKPIKKEEKDSMKTIDIQQLFKKYHIPKNPNEIALYATKPSKKWNELHQYYDWLDAVFPKEYSEYKYKLPKPPVWSDNVNGQCSKDCPIVLPTTKTNQYMDYAFLKKDD